LTRKTPPQFTNSLDGRFLSQASTMLIYDTSFVTFVTEM
jgi:hypothetical protein